MQESLPRDIAELDPVVGHYSAQVGPVGDELVDSVFNGLIMEIDPGIPVVPIGKAVLV
jgi:hypothetical protein